MLLCHGASQVSNSTCCFQSSTAFWTFALNIYFVLCKSLGRLQKARRAKNESLLYWADSCRGSWWVIKALALALTVVELPGKWVVDFGKMTAHSKGKSPCRAVRGVHANGKMVDAMLSPNGKLSSWRPIISPSSLCSPKLHLCVVHSDVRLRCQLTDVANTVSTWTTDSPKHLNQFYHCADVDVNLLYVDSHVGSSTVHKRGLLYVFFLQNVTKPLQSGFADALSPRNAFCVCRYRKTDMKGKYVSRLFTLTDSASLCPLCVRNASSPRQHWIVPPLVHGVGALQYSHGKTSSKKTQRQVISHKEYVVQSQRYNYWSRS